MAVPGGVKRSSVGDGAAVIDPSTTSLAAEPGSLLRADREIPQDVGAAVTVIAMVLTIL
ncbi:MAG: hypothetical protein OEZ14_17725 [Acidimicrobiia bacterium]|nr:hypothetical protein [Acidimicrobiia bacterium]